nr:CD63 antigen-like [Cherax quadricarinatus]
MALDTGMKCIKYLLFIFNLLFVISGFAVIIVGAVIEANYRTYLDFISSTYVSASSILIAVGVLIFVVGFFGCCGAVKENHCMVVTVSSVSLCCRKKKHACCGTDNYTDWKETRFGEHINGVPEACCIQNTDNCGNGVFSKPPSELDYINKEGCFDKLKGDAKENVTILGGVAIGIGFVQLIGVAFACCLAKSLKRQYETV